MPIIGHILSPIKSKVDWLLLGCIIDCIVSLYACRQSQLVLSSLSALTLVGSQVQPLTAFPFSWALQNGQTLVITGNSSVGLIYRAHECVTPVTETIDYELYCR